MRILVPFCRIEGVSEEDDTIMVRLHTCVVNAGGSARFFDVLVPADSIAGIYSVGGGVYVAEVESYNPFTILPASVDAPNVDAQTLARMLHSTALLLRELPAAKWRRVGSVRTVVYHVYPGANGLVEEALEYTLKPRRVHKRILAWVEHTHKGPFWTVGNTRELEQARIEAERETEERAKAKAWIAYIASILRNTLPA